MSQAIRILHLSDLHFGDFNRFAGRDPQRLGKAFFADLAEARRQLKDDGPIDLVVVSGDVAERGKPKEFAAGRAFLEALSGELGLPPRRFVFVPGNHDLSRPECEKVESDQKIEEFDDDELRRRIDAVKLKYYNAFVLGFYGVKNLREVDAQPLERDGWLYSFPELRLSVGALSSCEKENHKEHVGHLGEEQARNLMNAWRDGTARDWIKLVAIHHNPDLTTPNNLDSWKEKLKKEGISEAGLVDAYFSDICGLDGAERLKRIVADSEVQLVLHGHQHAGDEKIWSWRGLGQGYVLSAGSLGLSTGNLPKDEPLSCRLIRLELGAPASLYGWRMVFTPWARTPHNVEKGAFVLDPAERDGYRKRLDLPSAWIISAPGGTDPQADADGTKIFAEFLRVFRQRMRGLCSSWDLVGVPQNAASGQPIEGSLDEMYVEIRFHEQFDRLHTERGEAIGLEQIRRRARPLVIRGSAGSGKTTWIRRTFGRLLADEGFVPFLLVLRDLSAAWQETGKKGVERSLDAFIEGWVGEHLGAAYQPDVASRLLRSDTGPRPVLLVDGWDEVGELGESLRAKLKGLMHEVPLLLVIVTSRPYGSGRPSHSDGFETLEVQPLSDGEMTELSRRFFKICHRQDEHRAKKEAEAVGRALASSREARDLARTPLFLTMMLMIGRSQPLPDKRHALYEACIENLLQALPEKRRKDGALDLDHQWRGPEDSQERWRVVAKLAFEIQKQSYEGQGRGAIVRYGKELHHMLPDAWSRHDKDRFLAWLAGPAGLLRDHADDTYQFSHLSFQEFMAAWYLDSTREGEERTKSFDELGKSWEWWETLQLWAALIDRRNPKLMDGVLTGILEADWGGLSLTGRILADGSGSIEAMKVWTLVLCRTLVENWPVHGESCRTAWRSSSQVERKKIIAKGLVETDWSWISWYRARHLFDDVSVEEFPSPMRLLMSRALIEEVRDWNPRKSTDDCFLAASRIFAGRQPLWPLSPGLAGLLHLWPCQRRLLGCRIQAMAVLLRDVRISELGSRLIAIQSSNRAELSSQSHELARVIARHLSANLFTGEYLRDFAVYFAENFLCHLPNEVFLRIATHISAHLGSDYAGKVSDNFGNGFADYGRQIRYWGESPYFVLDGQGSRRPSSYIPSNFVRRWLSYFADEFVYDMTLSFARILNLSPNSVGLVDFVRVELCTPGRSASRFALATLIPQQEVGPALLFCLASRLSFQPDSDPEPFLAALDEIGPELHPIWPALAKHITRRSTTEDKALLLDFAEHPEKAGEPLCWALTFIVRGDVMREDGSIVTLDEMSAAAGLPPLPLLEDMPPELEF